MFLLIDDTKDLGCDVIARTPEGAKALLQSDVKFECVCFDYDLGTSETGLDIMKWAKECNVLPKRIQIVTGLQTAKQEMVKFLKNNGYQYDVNCWEVQK